ncbi:hypothetical protein [Halorubrum halophilum]|uniref:hypothetical protein n=1 Tax=Halorubrum halophilum TaxID=413816 RepID=UPI00186B4996|nr:hypothetical protein [Halorubrum halophilum]
MLNEVDGLEKTIKKITRAVDQGGEKFSCRDCGWKFSVIEDREDGNDNPLFQFESTFQLDPLKERVFTTIPIEYNQNIQFWYDLIVREGPEIEVLFLEQSEMDYLRQGKRFRVFTDHCKQGILQTNDSGNLPAGRHRMVLREDENHNDMSLVDVSMSAYPI